MGTKNTRWTPELVKKEAAKYRNVREFSDKARGAYGYASRYGLTASLFPNMRTKWNETNLSEELLKYSTRADLKRGNESAYNATKRLGLTHLLPEPQLISWTEDLALAEATKYSTRYEFQLGCQPAYHFLRVRGLLNSTSLTSAKPTLDMSKAAYVYVADVRLATGYGVVIGVSSRRFTYRYTRKDLKLMQNIKLFHFSSAKLAVSVESALKYNYIDYAVQKGESLFTEKIGITGEILKNLNRQALENDILYFSPEYESEITSTGEVLRAYWEL